MKGFIFLFIILLNELAFSQARDIKLTALSGMEDQRGNTHLFYRKYFYQGNGINYYTDNSIYHLDLFQNIDTLFLNERVNYNMPFGVDNYIFDYDFWNNDPSKYIYSGVNICFNNYVAYIARYDKQPTNYYYSFSGWNIQIEISRQNDSLIFSSLTQGILKSTNGGTNWFTVDSLNYLLFISPYDDNEIYALDNNLKINKSTDGGKTFYSVDTNESSKYPIIPKIIFDIDTTHIYRTSYHFNDSIFVPDFFVSNKGEPNSWAKKYSSTNNLYISIDDSVSGTIYLADGNKILLSTDYGNTFNVYKTLDSTIIGIYKKPSSDILYAATKYDIFEITSTTIKSIKHLITALDDKGNKVPNEFILYQNYPNPFNPSTTIKYQIPKSGLVQLKVYDILGREVAALVNEYQTAGEHLINFTTDNNQQTTNPHQLSSGVYFYQLKSGNYTQTKKLVLMK